jgi:DNA-binding transcriptional LysR family regulator
MRDAAEKLFVSQAALSHNLKKLETELDCQLFERSRNQLALNPYGRIMLEHAKRIIEELDQAKDEIAQEKLRQAEKIRVGIYGYAFQCFVMPSLANAIQENTFVCHIYESGQLREKLADGTLDVIFTDRPECDDELWTLRLFQEQVMVSLPASSEFASRQSIFLSDLRQLNILLVSDASGYTPWFERILKLADVASTHVDRVSFREISVQQGRRGAVPYDLFLHPAIPPDCSAAGGAPPGGRGLQAGYLPVLQKARREAPFTAAGLSGQASATAV